MFFISEFNEISGNRILKISHFHLLAHIFNRLKGIGEIGITAYQKELRQPHPAMPC